jgi:hypothetical protein
MRLLAAVVLALVPLFGIACKDGTRAPSPAVTARTFAESLAADVIPTCDETKLLARIESNDRPTAARLFCQWLRGAASYKLVSLRTVDGQPHPIMRRLISDRKSGAMFVGFDELVLATPKGASKPLLADVFAFRQGVWLSELLAANAVEGAQTDYLGASGKHAEVRAAQAMMRAGDGAGALAAIDALPPAVRKERGVQMLRVRSTVGLSTDAYKQALAELAQTFPDDPAIALIEIDGALDIEDFDGAMRWIDVLEKTIGVDAFLESTRAVALIRKGNLDQALERINAAVALEPTLTRALEIKLDVLIAKKQWPDVLATMTELETKHAIRFQLAELRAEPRLTELVESPAFAEWLQQRAAR